LPNFLYQLSPVIGVLIMLVFIETAALLGLWVARHFLISRLEYHEGVHEAVSGTVQAIGVFYGITVGLIAAGVWNTNSNASELVSKEAASIGSLYRDVGGYPSPVREELRSKLREYTVFIINEAWPAQKSGRGQTLDYGVRIMDDFTGQLYAFHPSNAGESVVHAETIRAFNTLHDYRRLRIDAVGSGLSSTMWAVIWVGAAISIGVAYFYKIPDWRLHAILIALMGGFLAMVVFMIVVNDKPFFGYASISADAYKLILERLIDVGK